MIEDSPDSPEIHALREHFSGCFTADGAFDIERFREFLLGKIPVNDGFGLCFTGKNNALRLASQHSAAIVQPDEAHNAKPENANSENIFICGDNLDGLKYLRKHFSQSIRCIYIDPPYNTGADNFTYNDRFGFASGQSPGKLPANKKRARRISNRAKRDSASHSAWLAFMYPRLLLARDLLTQDGVIFVSID
ncbi:MAG TPA: restriction endonuclease subunit M, partial [Treponema sp.]|nr:restriction endonuclease subunit M [Treponema sp.]